MVDFSGLVLSPNIAVFGKSVTVTPKTSQPLAQPYAANGIWTVEQFDVPLDDGGMLSSQRLKLGIRLADFAFAPKQGDWISTAASDLPLAYWQGEFEPGANLDLVVDDFQPDGQGGATLILKRVKQ
jgi:hypothetical protein